MTRHMRLLEQCAPAWPAQDLQAQILSLRQAFSVDLNKPFELKANLPAGVGFESFSPSPGPESYDRGINSHPHDQLTHFHTHPMTPPISARNVDDPRDNSLLATRRPVSVSGSDMGDHSGSWNPTRLFEYANKISSRLDENPC